MPDVKVDKTLQHGLVHAGRDTVARVHGRLVVGVRGVGAAGERHGLLLHVAARLDHDDREGPADTGDGNAEGAGHFVDAPRC